MNNTKRLLSLILTAILIVSCLGVGVAVSAAAPASVAVSYAAPNKTVEVEAGQALTINIVEDPCSALNAKYSFSNASIFAATPVASHNAQGSTANNKFNAYNAEPMRIVCTISAQIAASAKVGDQCVVNFTECLYGDQVGGDGGHDDYTMSVTIVVKETKVPTTTTKQPTSTGLNFRELNNQIAIAEGLNSEGYTAESWANLDAALKLAKEALSAKKQADINAAAQALKTAIASLVAELSESAKALTSVIQEVKDYLEKDKVASAYKALTEAIAEAEAALAGGESEAIDAALTKLKAAFEAYKQQIKELSKTEIIEVEKPVPTEPEGEFCNVRIHKVWLILMIISFILNLFFIALIVYYFVQKKKREEAKPEKKSSDDNSLIM